MEYFEGFIGEPSDRCRVVRNEGQGCPSSHSLRSKNDRAGTALCPSKCWYRGEREKRSEDNQMSVPVVAFHDPESTCIEKPRQRQTPGRSAAVTAACTAPGQGRMIGSCLVPASIMENNIFAYLRRRGLWVGDRRHLWMALAERVACR